MCYAIPGKVKEIQDKTIIVDYFGEDKKAHNELEDLQIGDYVYAQGGYVINKITPEEAEVILNTWKEMFFELQETDVKLAKVDMEDSGVDKKIASRRLRARTIFLRRIKRDLQAIKKNLKKASKHHIIILNHDLDLVSAEIKSITSLIETLS